MKLIYLWLLVAGAPAFAQDCPDLSGTYTSTYNVPVRYAQEGCTKLTRWSAPRYINGGWVFRVKRDFELGGAGVCSQADATKCEFAKVENAKIVFSWNFDAKKMFGDHGLCTEQKSTIEKVNGDHLLVTSEITACKDNFSGTFQNEFVPTTL